MVICINVHIIHLKNGTGKCAFTSYNSTMTILIFGFKRRWFILTGTKLLYQKKTENELSIMENDLRVCKVREINDLDRRFTFELFSPKWLVFK